MNDTNALFEHSTTDTGANRHRHSNQRSWESQASFAMSRHDSIEQRRLDVGRVPLHQSVDQLKLWLQYVTEAQFSLVLKLYVQY